MRNGLACAFVSESKERVQILIGSDASAIE